MHNQLGISLKKRRNQLNFSQKETAKGICAQSMLSAIENGKYLPSAKLLINLCQRLSISLTEISLLKDFEISTQQNFNQKLTELCNKHDYAALKNFLLATETIAHVQTAEQTQAYYYYLGVAKLHLDANLSEAAQNLRLAISAEESRTASPLKRLSLISLGLIKVKQGHLQAAFNLLKKATSSIKDANYVENLNIVFYLAALINYEADHINSALKWLEDAITYITAHNSHYMLANCYQLRAQIAKESGQADQQLEAHRRSLFLKDLFGEKTNEEL
ncbi:helix-turn-helix transcriptional regulator [Liquorilactobacillus satsumensis]|uniref:helix-turn-helix transcriptional regulator n=1 Tax=Liquorilactobacillus satsumensis TaxID=259059 RepID=UPI001E352E4B|nr:helix-turn-helix transcriptional regulator [Liquorilactobacillus satsumensis]MCC7666444.1 transcriptional regulator [Liquorilactobacillus satsumensis]